MNIEEKALTVLSDDERAAMLVFSFGGVQSRFVFSTANSSSRFNYSLFDLFYKNFILNWLKKLVKGVKKTIKVGR